MMKVTLALVGILAGLMGLGHSGNEAGNGGNVVVCREPSGVIESVELLDFHEGWIVPPPVHYTLGPNTLTVFEKVDLALRRLGRLDVKRAEAFRAAAKTFLLNTEWEKKALLQDTNDYGYIPIKPNCKIEQVAVQKEPKEPGQKRYRIHQGLWDQLNADHQAGLVLHEIIYGDALKRGHRDSINSRKFTALVSSSQLNEMTVRDYEAVLRKWALSDDPSSIKPPAWVMDPVVLKGACVGKAYTANLAAFVHDPGGSPLEFVIQYAPSWLSLTPEGVLRGTPKKSDLGNAIFEAEAWNGRGAARVRVRLSVSACEQEPPVWSTSTLDFGVQNEGAAFSLDLKRFLSGGASEGVRFSAINLPPWMRLDATDGVLAGIPNRKDVGRYDGIIVTARNVHGAASVQAIGEVRRIVQPPHWIQSVIDVPDATEDTLYLVDMKQFVRLREGTSPTFTKIGGPSWLSMTAQGVLKGVAGKNDLGSSEFRVSVHAGEAGDIATIRLRVRHVAHPPYWLQDPVRFTACASQTFSADLQRFVNDIDGLPLSFLMDGGPSWLTLDLNGRIFGVPSLAHSGENAWLVRATNAAGLSAAANVYIKVEKCR